MRTSKNRQRGASSKTAPRTCTNTGDCTTLPTVYELNRMVDAWDSRCKAFERKRGIGLPNRVRARGGTWLAAAATLLGVRVQAVSISGIPRPAIKYRGIWFINYGKEHE